MAAETIPLAGGMLPKQRIPCVNSMTYNRLSGMTAAKVPIFASRFTQNQSETPAVT